MSKHAKPAPKHRGAPNRPVSVDAPKKALRTTLVMSSVAVAATGATISTGLLSSAPASVSATAADLGDAFPDAGSTAEGTASSTGTTTRDQVVSRSGGDRREASDPIKVSELSQETGGAMSATESLSDDDPRDIAKALLGEFGFSSDQFGCLDSLWTRESGWSISADNPSSSAYGIPQALTATHDLGADYMTNPVTQIEWGLGYIRDRYGSPCGAWAHSQSTGWY